MDANFSNELKTVLDQSQVEATRHNDNVIRAEHLLLAILSKHDSNAFRVLQRLLDDDTMYRLRDNLDNSLYKQRENTEGMGVSDLANRIIKLSVLEARMLKTNVVDSEHLLLALFHNNEVQNLDIMAQFREVGVTYETLYKLLANVTDAPKMGASFSEDDDDEDDDIFRNDPKDQSSGQQRTSAPKRGIRLAIWVS